MIVSSFLEYGSCFSFTVLIRTEPELKGKYPNRILHFIIPNLFLSAGLNVFFSKRWLRTTLACWGSAFARALLSALSSYSYDAEAPPSINPACMEKKVLLVLVWRPLSIDYCCYSWVFWVIGHWGQLSNKRSTSSVFHHLHKRFALASEMIEIRSWIRKEGFASWKVFAILEVIFLFRVIVLLVEHFFNLNINHTPITG